MTNIDNTARITESSVNFVAENVPKPLRSLPLNIYMKLLYSVWYGNEGVSSSDVYRYVISRKLLGFVFSIH
jgi:hypothetical protein